VDLAGPQELIHDFPQITALINEHLARIHQSTGQVGKVLVFCESGNERSAAVIAAYLMETHVDVDFIKAMQLVQAQRFCANFDDGLKRLLQSYWDILCARRQVAALNEAPIGVNGVSNGAVATPPKAKRGLQRDDDDEMDGMEGDDGARFGGRTFAPFADRPL